jgi:hypothetical protein
MEYDVVASKERLTGRAYFAPSDAPVASMPWLDLGNIQLMNLDYGIKRKEHFKARRGILIADRFDAYSATPRWEITGDEYASAILFLIFLGTDGGNLTQSAATGQVINFNGHKGGVLDVGKFCLYNWSVGSGAVSGVDYIVDPGPGKLYIPEVNTGAGNIAEGAARALTVSWPTIVFDRILPPMSNLNRSGTMQLIEEDDSAAVSPSAVGSPKTVHDFPVSLSTDTGGQTKVDDYKSFKMIATITDPASWVIRKRYS